MTLPPTPLTPVPDTEVSRHPPQAASPVASPVASTAESRALPGRGRPRRRVITAPSRFGARLVPSVRMPEPGRPRALADGSVLDQSYPSPVSFVETHDVPLKELGRVGPVRGGVVVWTA
ncbi:hypothetical protein GCM10009814_02780 [Lapillicoccus jejuensis]